MKTKKTGKKLDLLVKRITSLVGKGDSSRSEPASEKMKNLQTELEVSKGLQVEIKTLKSTLKSRKKELADGVARLEKSRKKVKKNLKEEKKSKNKSQKESGKNKAKIVSKAKKPAKTAEPKPGVTAHAKVKKTKTKAKPEK
jgi:predicted  nucleic acid-binding Zn-ribbon protein